MHVRDWLSVIVAWPNFGAGWRISASRTYAARYSAIAEDRILRAVFGNTAGKEREDVMTYAVKSGGRIRCRALPSMIVAQRIAAQYDGGRAIIDPRSVQR